jgi:CelD/BcsL family acetyltransferase involved in cellulose biosynthesis
MELHALICGGRAVATFGALPGRDRLCGLILAHDPDPEIASCGPGRLLLQEVIRSGIERRFKTLDLGVGEARYKREHCEKAEPLFDLFLATTTLGRPAATALSLGAGSKRE